MHPIYILLDTASGATQVLEASNKWIWELNSPVSPGSNAKIISTNMEWNYRLKDTLYFVHAKNAESDAFEYLGLYGDQAEAVNALPQGGLLVTLQARRYGHIVLYLREK